ncbi:bifunctional lysine-specific demethylase and histidyl-hydroxylase NO66 [Bicyclus anynana]|uniref:Bifunctional lysine-specific demethylase and histidyl-hydroxylase n=1 Tax=Bicyclus anynana TaxID=110368 RepID=A0ABM3LPE6_BICAN|nr:bifunctional lysine-specific demethylase and histidyl-hydroxylase NO66 [Bicyclus anynana]
MDSSVSAFAVYNASSNQHKKKKNKKVKTVPPPKIVSNDVGDNLMKELGSKLKSKQSKKKESKNIVKKKLHKKKKSKKKSPSRIEKDRKRKSSESTDEDVPQIFKTPFQKQNEVLQYDNPSSESEGSCDFTPVQTDSSEEGLKVFKWMISPFSPEDFFNQIWEKRPLHISRENPKYYNELISTPKIDSMLRNENIQYTKNIDITSYVDKKRETHNPEGRAHPHIVWDFYLNGCSIRLLNPQTYMSKLHLLNATLQEFFHSFVGANAYLTPPDSQGFAPHYDDIEAFILQAEGKKHWRIYKPRDDLEVLPRTSSINFTEENIGQPLLEVTLEAGDMLYFPRGYIHQGVTIDGEHSLHVTVSMYQKHAWADLFEKMIPAALQMAINENVELRKGLPFDIFENFGLVHSDVNTPRKTEIEEVIKKLFNKIQDHLPIDEAVDQISKKFQQDALPPVLTDLEKAVTVYGDTDVMVENGKVINRVEIGLDTRIRLLRKNIIRMVSEESVRLYYYAENSLEYHGNELSFLEIEEDMAPAIETLINAYPEYVSVENLDTPHDTDKLQIADGLWSRGLIMTEYPLENLDDD